MRNCAKYWQAREDAAHFTFNSMKLLEFTRTWSRIASWDLKHRRRKSNSQITGRNDRVPSFPARRGVYYTMKTFCSESCPICLVAWSLSRSLRKTSIGNQTDMSKPNAFLIFSARNPNFVPSTTILVSYTGWYWRRRSMRDIEKQPRWLRMLPEGRRCAGRPRNAAGTPTPEGRVCYTCRTSIEGPSVTRDRPNLVLHGSAAIRRKAGCHKLQGNVGYAPYAPGAFEGSAVC